MTEENFIFLLLGKTGNGKSATGNSILGSNAFCSDDSNEAVTSEITLKSTVRGSYQVTVIDTPGFMDTHVDIDEAKSKAVADMKKAMAQCPTNGKLALVVVLRYGDRDTHDNKLSLHILKQIFGEENVGKSCIIVMTHGDLYNTKFKGEKCFKEWMKERPGDLGDFLKMSGYKCVLFSNETAEDGLKKEQFKTLIELVKTLDQGYTQSKFESEKKKQSRLELEAVLPSLREMYDKEIEIMHNEMEEIGDDPQAIKALDELDIAITQLLNNVNEKDSSEVIFYADGETRLLEKTSKSINEIKKLVVEKKETMRQMVIAGELKNKMLNIQNKIKGVSANEIEIKSIMAVIKQDIESIDLTQLDGAIWTEMDTAFNTTKEKFHELENRVTLFLNLEHPILILKDTSKALVIPCRLSDFKRLHDECDQMFQKVETCVSNNEDRAVLTKRLNVIKNAIIDKKKENDIFIAGELKNKIVKIQKEIEGINVSDINIKSILSVIQKEIESLDLNQLDGAIWNEMAAAVENTREKLRKLEKRVTLFLDLQHDILMLKGKSKAFEIPCRLNDFKELLAEFEKLFQKVQTCLTFNEDRVVLTKRLGVIKNAIIDKKKQSDMLIAGELKNTIVKIQNEIEGIKVIEIKIKSILPVIQKEIESLDLTQLDGAIWTEMAAAVENTREKLRKLEKRVTLFLDLEHDILMLKDKSKAFEIPCRLRDFKELLAEIKKLFQKAETCITNNEDRAVLTKRLGVIKNAIIDKKKESDMLITEELKNKIVKIQNKLKGINANEIEIKSILFVIRQEIESLDLTQIDGAMRTEMDTSVEKTTRKLHKLEKRVTLFLNLEQDILILTEKYRGLKLPSQLSDFKELHAECDKLFEDVKTSWSKNEDKAVLTKRLDVIKKKIIERNNENDTYIAELCKEKKMCIQNKIEQVDANEIDIKTILSDLKKDIESLDLTQLDGAIRTEMAAAVENTREKLHKLEKRVTLFLNLEHAIQFLTDKYNGLEIPCDSIFYTELHAESDKLLEDVKTGISNNEDRTVLVKRLEVIKNAIIDKKKENDKKKASRVLVWFPPIVGPIVSLALYMSSSDPLFVKHDKRRELEEAAHGKQL